MRSFFKRPSWASRGEESMSSDFYRRSEQTYADIIAANKDTREKLATHVDDSPVEDGKTSKYRRISGETHTGAETPFHTHEVSFNLRNGMVDDQEFPSTTQDKSHEKFNGREQHIELKKSGNPTSGKIDISNNHFPVIHGHGHDQKFDKQSTGRHIQTQSKSLQDTAQEDSSLPTTPVLENTTTCGQRIVPDANVSSETPQEDLVVQILITSEIENSKPLIVHRKMSQALKDVRLAWCKRQNFTDEMQSSVFLTWKGRRLFDVTTCKSLGVNGRHRRPHSPGLTDDPWVDDGNIRIHVEAVTEELLNYSNHRTSSPTEVGEDSTHIQNGGNASIRVILKCPGLDDYKTKISPKTKISRLVAAFSESQELSEDLTVHLLFDGDRLDPNMRLVDYDIADLDLVDVLIK